MLAEVGFSAWEMEYRARFLPGPASIIGVARLLVLVLANEPGVETIAPLVPIYLSDTFA